MTEQKVIPIGRALVEWIYEQDRDAQRVMHRPIDTILLPRSAYDAHIRWYAQAQHPIPRLDEYNTVTTDWVFRVGYENRDLDDRWLAHLLYRGRPEDPLQLAEDILRRGGTKDCKVARDFIVDLLNNRR
jgi:hypothetical protein